LAVETQDQVYYVLRAPDGTFLVELPFLIHVKPADEIEHTVDPTRAYQMTSYPNLDENTRGYVDEFINYQNYRFVRIDVVITISEIM
jgi:hypothetical protein